MIIVTKKCYHDEKFYTGHLLRLERDSSAESLKLLEYCIFLSGLFFKYCTFIYLCYIL